LQYYKIIRIIILVINAELETQCQQTQWHQHQTQWYALLNEILSHQNAITNIW